MTKSDWCCFTLLAFVLFAQGCSSSRLTNTPRTGMEQLLISNAVDQVLDKVDYRRLQGAKVFVQEKYLDSVDKGYIVGSVRHRVLYAGGQLVNKPEEADIVMELRSGGVGTDDTETYIGFPGVALPGPMPVELPEVKFWNRTSQLGTAKLAITAYDTQGRPYLDFGGQGLARSDDSNAYFFGFGPIQSGTVRDEVFVATGRGNLTTRVGNSLQSYQNQITAAAPTLNPRMANASGAPYNNTDDNEWNGPITR